MVSADGYDDTTKSGLPSLLRSAAITWLAPNPPVTAISRRENDSTAVFPWADSIPKPDAEKVPLIVSVESQGMAGWQPKFVCADRRNSPVSLANLPEPGPILKVI